MHFTLLYIILIIRHYTYLQICVIITRQINHWFIGTHGFRWFLETHWFTLKVGITTEVHLQAEKQRLPCLF